MKRTAICLASAILLVFPAFTFAWSGKVVEVHDGDTISVMHFGRAERIRLFGVDCPEHDQDFGTRASQFTADFAFGKIAQVLPADRDEYGRTVAWVSVEGKSLNKELVRAGLAWWYRRYAEDNLELRDLESEALKNKLGLWSKPNPVPPWLFRRTK
ncbi:MAG: thermonuclease family protein [Desulfomonile tiedjei]|nr:thermonuclease family protein [Desulfomonile tiedjei]